MLLGSLASALALSAHRLPDMRPPLWLGAALLLWMLSLPLGAPPSLRRTTGWCACRWPCRTGPSPTAAAPCTATIGAR